MPPRCFIASTPAAAPMISVAKAGSACGVEIEAREQAGEDELERGCEHL
jgi:hypothetical protein